MKCVLDTDVIVASLRSKQGASREIVRRVAAGEIVALASVAMLIEYEAVLKRLEHLNAANLTEAQVDAFIDAIANLMVPVAPYFLWRPQLRDPNDEMILETAVNGQADTIVTFNIRHYGAVARRFGITVQKPSEFLGRLNR